MKNSLSSLIIRMFPSLVELSIDQVREANSLIWAPRWTQGTQTSDSSANAG